MTRYCRRLGRLPSRSCAKFVGSSLRAHLFVKEGACQAFHSRSSANLHFVLPQPFSRYFCLLGPPNRCRFYAARRRRSNNHKHRHCGIVTPLFLYGPATRCHIPQCTKHTKRQPRGVVASVFGIKPDERLMPLRFLTRASAVQFQQHPATPKVLNRM
ncbi:hypothetical protein DFP72DRAFT_549825 [Ephemerocybe angulata]|uniref:Uncharacterized protein n=1 Tax=Ephemerocybe angulata TaxID=980116 RepID=A0A8H6HNE5_9AGAR|nr:hypothetical protein DFP72DRAFT_549825 [Tulosesus angulatus]